MLTSNKAYTILEVLVATFIFALAISIATNSFGDSINLLKKIAEKDEPVLKLSKNLWVDNVFLCTTDYFVKDEADGRFYLFFDGKPDSIAFITECSLNSNLPSLTYVVKEPNGSGNYDLRLYQMEVGTMSLREIERAIIFSDIKKKFQTTIISDASLISIHYLAYDRDKKSYSWKNDYRFRQHTGLPSAIRVSYQKDGLQNQLFFKILNNNGSKNFYNEFYYGK